MKIKKLVIENINSLYGHFEIDFDSPSFANGIFAITGPTGSGKTTILDAMCLALFGITPRLKSGERGEALSKGTAKGLAELTFEVDEKVYLASCAMTPSSVKHTISCNEVILESSVRNTPGKVREILGLTMEQFCRAVLLAQGKFDAFLEAGVKDKADILEQITGTEMYSKIAGKANQIYRQLKHQVEQEEAVSQAWQILDKDTELQKRSELEELNKQNIFVSGSYEKLNKLLTDFGKIASTEKLLLDNRQAQDILAREKADFTVDARRLVSGEKAVRLQPAFTAWKTCHQEYTANCQKAENLTTVLPELEKKKNAIFQHLQEIQEKCTVLKKEDEELIALTGKVLVLDNTLSQKQTGVEITRKKLLQSLEKQKEQNEALRDLETQLKILDEEKTGWLQYLEEHKNDQALSAQKARWQEQMLQVSSLQNQERSCQTELKKLQQALSQALSAVEEKKQLWKKAVAEQGALKQLEKTQKAELAASLQDKSLDTWEQELTLRQENLMCLRKIHSYEEERKNLADGKACPLCGSLEHPFALGNIPQMTEKEKEINAVKAILSAARQKNQELAETEKKANACQLTCTRLEGEFHLAEKEVSSKETEEKRLQEQLQKTASELSLRVAGLSEELASAGFVWKDFSQLPEEIDQRILACSEAAARLAALDQKNNTILTGLAVLRKQQGENAVLLDELRKEENSSLKEIETLTKQRTALFGSKDPVQEREASQKKLESASEQCLQETTAHTRAYEELRMASESLKNLEEIIKDQLVQSAQLREAFEHSCRREEMTAENFEASLLDSKELTRLVAIRSNLETRRKTLLAEQEKYTGELILLKKDFPIDFDEEKSRQELADLKEKNSALLLQIGGLKSDLEKNEQTRQARSAQLEQLEALKKKCAVWHDLDTLIGGENGFRFKKIVQRLTLDSLLVNANNILEKMNRRYELLQRDGDDDPLIIDVVDHCQGSNIRPSGNLSGGERFQVSLALALGLSAMAGEKIRIDSLFLDEGFGTLDPDSLKNALQTLAVLQHSEGKTIGIISHVQTISENITSVIEVIPCGGGRSRLSGTGVTFQTESRPGKRRKKVSVSQ